MSGYIHLSAMLPRANPAPGLVKPVEIGYTMCGMEYGWENPDVVDPDWKDEVTCPKCMEKIANSGMAI